MSKYTVQLREVIDVYGEDEVKGWFMNYNLSDYLTQEEIDTINERGTWDKEKLASLIIDKYYIREIGLETPELFKHQAGVLMREIMEEKAPLIWSASIKYDPLVNMDLLETYDQDQTNVGSSTSNSSGLSVASDTPQGQINKAEVLSGKYASSTGADETSDSTNTSGSGTMKYSKRIVGNSGVSFTPMSAITDYRKIILTINRDIIKEVGQLFMGVY